MQPLPTKGVYAVCDACGAHASGLPMCQRCRMVRYCDTHCQRFSWQNSFHRCANTRKPADGGNEYSHCFETVVNIIIEYYPSLRSSFLALGYTKYRLVIDAWARGKPSRIDRKFNCPRNVVKLIERLYAPNFNDEINESLICATRGIFTAITACSLPNKSPLSWRDIKAPQPMSFVPRSHYETDTNITISLGCYQNRFTVELTGHQTEMSLYIVHSHKHVPRTDGASIGTCIFFNNAQCLKHGDILTSESKILSVSFISHDDMDVFTRMAMIDTTAVAAHQRARNMRPCECVDELRACDLTRADLSEDETVPIMHIAVVRIVMTTGIIDIIAHNTRLRAHNETTETEQSSKLRIVTRIATLSGII